MTPLQLRLNLPTPIVQAPMAGASDSTFVIAGCQAGALGSLGAGMLAPDVIAQEIHSIKRHIDTPFNVNLMILSHTDTQRYACPVPQWLLELYNELGLAVCFDERPTYDFDQQLKILHHHPVPVASFTFGILTTTQVKALQNLGSLVIGTANNVAEVQAWQAVGADAVVVQGIEAGGHQGGWLTKTAQRLPMMTLLALAKQHSNIPLIAAGGICNRRQIADALALGADLVAVGTVFLTTNESIIPPTWQQALLKAKASDTQLTRLFSGKHARAISNGYLQRFASLADKQIPSYPTLNAYTKALRNYAKHTQNPNYMSLWAGTGVHGCQHESIKDLIKRLTDI